MRLFSPSQERTLRQALRKPPGIFLFLDYDGTLTPIRSHPDLARLEDRVRGTLKRLSRNPRIRVGIISGRRVDDLEAHVRLEGIYYAGNHGLEIEGPEYRFRHARARRFLRAIAKIRKKLGPLADRYPGSWIEFKGVSITLHYRQVARQRALQRDFHRFVRDWVRAGKVRVLRAKKALEVRPSLAWDKGSAVRWFLLRENSEFYPVYVGDDRTDESAFTALRERGTAIRVGRHARSAAACYVKDPEDVRRFLSWLGEESRSEKAAGSNSRSTWKT